MPQKIIILVVDDEAKHQEAAKKAADRVSNQTDVEIELLTATSYIEAIAIFDERADEIDAITLDWTLSESAGAYNGGDVMEYIHGRFGNKPILSMSSSPPMNKQLVKYGCAEGYLSRAIDWPKNFRHAFHYIVENLAK